MKHSARFHPSSDQSLLIYFGEKISLDANQCVIKLLRLLEADPIAGVRNLHPGYSSLLVKFDGLRLGHSNLQEILLTYLDRIDDLPSAEPRQIVIPVCYGEEFGPDLDEVSSMHGITPPQAVEMHTSVNYVVHFLGFVPGFAYLGDLPQSLVTSRLPTPRSTVSGGSVGIADAQTAVYPFATPGGWRLIGRTPVAMFRPDRADMSLLSIGDRVRFVPISREEFAKLENACP